MSNITVNRALCGKCGLCTFVCPESIFVQENGSIPKIARAEACISCSHCVAACPARAISHKDFPQGSIIPVNDKGIPSADQVLEMLRAKRSIRAVNDRINQQVC